MSDFSPTWLYIKQHNVTGLKYFGKTKRTNPYTYHGSGQYWLDHLNKHGKNITTIWCQLFTDKESITEYALQFSKENNIVESKEWTNLIPELGYEDGGAVKGQPGTKHTEITKEKIRAARQKQPDPMLGKTHKEESKQKISSARLLQSPPMLGKKHSEETKAKIRETKLRNKRLKELAQ